MPLKIIEREEFDPEGAGYDYQTALEYGLRPDEIGHWDSRIRQTGMLLKGRAHPTWDKTIQEEKEAGYQIIKVGDRYMSIPKSTLRANVPLPIKQGLVSPGLKKAYRKVLSELSKGVEPPERDIALQPDEGLPTGITRLLKLYALDVPGSFLKRGGQALESPDALTFEDLLRLAGETTFFGMGGAGRGVAGMGVRKPRLKPLKPEPKGLSPTERLVRTFERKDLSRQIQEELKLAGGFKDALPSQKRKIIRLIQKKRRASEGL